MRRRSVLRRSGVEFLHWRSITSSWRLKRSPHTPLMSAGILLWLNNEPDRANTHASFRERDAWAEQTVLRNTSVLNIGVCSDVTHKIVSITKLKKCSYSDDVCYDSFGFKSSTWWIWFTSAPCVCVCEREREREIITRILGKRVVGPTRN